MKVKIVRLSTKGQIVIPQEIRENLKLKEGDMFIVLPLSNDIIVLKKITFNEESYKTFKKELKEVLEELGVKIDEKIIDKAIRKLIEKYSK